MNIRSMKAFASDATPLGETFSEEIAHLLSSHRPAPGLSAEGLRHQLGCLIVRLHGELSRHETVARLALQEVPDIPAAADTCDLLHLLLEHLEVSYGLCLHVAGHLEAYLQHQPEAHS